MESKVSRRLKEPPAPEVCDAIYAPRLARDFGVVFPYLTDVNQAHVLMLHKSGLVTCDIARKLAAGLLQMEAEGPRARPFALPTSPTLSTAIARACVPFGRQHGRRSAA